MTQKANIKNVEEFIQMVRDRPILYDPRHLDFYKINRKEQAWMEVATEAIAGWDDLDASQRVEQGEFLRRFLLLLRQMSL